MFLIDSSARIVDLEDSEDGQHRCQIVGGDLLTVGDGQLGLDNLVLIGDRQLAEKIVQSLNNMSLPQRVNQAEIGKRARAAGEQFKRVFGNK